MLQDLRFSCRSLLQARGFAAAAILTLGLGIGATTIVYSIVEGILLRPLPFGDRSERLVTIHSTHPTETADTQMDDAGVSYADLMDFRDAARGFEAIEIISTRSVSLASASESERVAAASVTPGLFRMLGVAPVLGRDFRFEQVAIISDGLWKRLYASDPGVGGQSPTPMKLPRRSRSMPSSCRRGSTAARSRRSRSWACCSPASALMG